MYDEEMKKFNATDDHQLKMSTACTTVTLGRSSKITTKEIQDLNEINHTRRK